jgi:hypothetical protein
MSTAITLALISGAVSLIAAAISLASNRGVARLSAELEEQQRIKTRAEQAAELRARYRDPLLGAAFDLQSRLYNIVAKSFLGRYLYDGEDSRRYAIDNTLHLFAEYLAWMEIIRREIQFLDLGGEIANRKWLLALEDLRDILARDDIDAVLRIFRGEQRAIGETMTVRVEGSANGRSRESLGYAQFVSRRQQEDFNCWFQRLENDLVLLADDPRAHLERTVLLQNKLIDVIEILDPQGSRFPPERRTRLSTGGA